ncbi:MAG TPA: hypothetical protein VKJ47_19085 [Candidatus Binatia bacterium]|nr:hypothetical protein [Candidatus Binatia bacterium]
MHIDIQWPTVLSGVILCGLIGAGLWKHAYRLGVKHGRAMLLPFPLIDELIEHRINCLGQDPTKAQIEVENSFGLAE